MDHPLFTTGLVFLMILSLLILMNMHTSDIFLKGATNLFLIIVLGGVYWWLKNRED
jgi:hypothetical protein